MVQDNVAATTPAAADRPDPRGAITRALRSSGDRSFRVGLVLGAIVTVAVVILIIQNGESAQLDWMVFDFRTPLWIMLFLTAAAGAVVWELAKTTARRARRVRGARRAALRAARDARP
jgi:uncharacterized integral membrane protein